MSVLVDMRIVHELSVSLAVGGVQGPVLHQQVHQPRRGRHVQVPAKHEQY